MKENREGLIKEKLIRWGNKVVDRICYIDLEYCIVVSMLMVLGVVEIGLLMIALRFIWMLGE
jgi:hypothetical protein